MSSPLGVTALLLQSRIGNSAALDQLIPLLYQELRRLAKRQMVGQPPGHTLRTTDLIHEAYLKLVRGEQTEWKDRWHFLAVASRTMRSVLVDHARRRRYAKHGANPLRVMLQEDTLVAKERGAEVIALDQALSRLGELDPRKTQIVELRYFGGFTVEQTAEVIGISPITVKREWARAKGWLYRELAHERDRSPHPHQDRGAGD